jgi:WD40 repeat protein
VSWSDGTADENSSIRHENQLIAIKVLDSVVYSAGMDDFLKTLNLKDSSAQSFKLETQPRSLGVSEKRVAVVAGDSQIILHSGEQSVKTLVQYQPTVCSIQKDLLAVGAEDGAVHFYKVDGLDLQHLKRLAVGRGCITCLSFSNDGIFVAVGTDQRCVQLVEVSSDFTV